MSTKEVSSFYFFKSREVRGKRVPLPEDKRTALYHVRCEDCHNSFALCALDKNDPLPDWYPYPVTKEGPVGNELCPRCKSKDSYSIIRKYSGTVEGKNRLKRALEKGNEGSGWETGAGHLINTRRIKHLRTHETKYNSETKSWLLIGTANLPRLPSIEPDFSKFHSFLGKNNVYHVKQSPGRINSDYTGGEYCNFYFIGSEAKFRTKGPYLICKRRTGPGNYIYYKGRLFLSDSKEEVLTHVDGVGIKEDDVSHRERIPDDTQIFIWNRDGGACVKCGSSENLAFDHIIPHSLGGSNARRNLQLLCDSCNSKKGNKIGG